MVLPKVGGEIFWDDSEWAVKVRHPTIPSTLNCCRDSPLALICLSESSYSWHPKDGTLILEMRLSFSSLLASNDPRIITNTRGPRMELFWAKTVLYLEISYMLVKIFLFLAPKRWTQIHILCFISNAYKQRFFNQLIFWKNISNNQLISEIY